MKKENRLKNQNHLSLLGFKVRDVVTGLTGVVTSISFDLYGCVQAIVHVECKKNDAKPGDGFWFDTKRLKAISKLPVMSIPTFEVVPGPASKPAFEQKPIK